MSKFNTSNAANSIVNIIQTSIGNAAFDTTIRAIVQEKVDEATGKFKLQYQDGLFYAFADDVKVNYSKGTEVFVLVPKNDFTQDKRIIGSVKTLGEDYVSVFTYDERYKKIGKSAFEAKNSGWFSIKSKATDIREQSEVLYDKADKINSPLALDDNFLSYLKKEQVNGLWLEGTFKTYLNQIQDFNGANYGLRLTFSVGKEEDELPPLTVQLDANSMEGTPFNLSGNRQVIVFSGIDWSTVYRIDKIEFFAEGFSINSVEEDLFVKDIKMYAVSYISDEEQMKSGLTLSSPKGLYIDGAPIDLTATLRIDGKVQRDKVIYYWFIKDPTITANSNVTNPDGGVSPTLVYNAAGGPGWRCLNSATVTKEVITPAVKDKGVIITPEEAVYTINWADGTNTWTFDSESIPSAQATIMCVAKFENTLYTDTITIYDKDQKEYFVLTASKEFFTKSEQEITLTLKRQNEEDGVGWETYQWYQQGLYGGAPVPITEGIVDNTTFGVKGSSIINEATYMVVVQGTEKETGETISFITNPVTLSMRLDEQEEVPPQYTLTIINGDQVFQYSEEGYAPNSPAWVTHSPQDIKALSFVLFDNQLGSAVEAESYEWTIPENETLLREKDGTSEVDKTYAFEIASMYNASYSNNQITLEVTYNGMTFTATTNFVFVKQGDPGTNGTDVVIVVTGEPQFDDKGEYQSGLTVTKYVGASKEPIETNDIKHISNSVCKATVKEDDKVYYGYYVPPIPGEINIGNMTYRLVGKPSQYVVYDADGSNPKYADFQFEKKTTTEDGTISWSPVSAKFSYGAGTNKESLYAVIPKAFDSALAASEGVFQITAYDGDTQITTITLLASLNRHAFSMVNGWDGNLTIDNSNNYMLAATVAAGKKNEDNTFTGVMIGTVGDSTNSQHNKTGFFGFNHGVQTAFIDAEDGSTRLGNSVHTLFQIGDNYSEEFLQSSNYQNGEEIRTVTLKDSAGVSTTYPYNQWSSNNIVVVYAESTHTTPIGAIKGAGYDTSSDEPAAGVQYIKGYLKDSSTEEYVYVTNSTTTLYKGENFSYQLNPKKGMRIDLKNGSILAPGYYLNGTNGEATFEGKVTATSGEFANGVILGAGGNKTDVGSMLTSLNGKIDSLREVGGYLQYQTTGSGWTETTIAIGATKGQLLNLSSGFYTDDYGNLLIAAQAIKTGLVAVSEEITILEHDSLSDSLQTYCTPIVVNGSIAGYNLNYGFLGGAQGQTDNKDTACIVLKSYSYDKLKGGGIFLVSDAGVRMSMSNGLSEVYITSGGQVTLKTGSSGQLVWEKGNTRYTISIEP